MNLLCFGSNIITTSHSFSLPYTPSSSSHLRFLPSSPHNFTLSVRKNLVVRVQTFGAKSEPKLIDIKESGKELPELSTNLYPHIEPYSTGFLEGSDIHTIYWEQSGNPTGHRGSGKSTPHACLDQNTTWDLVDDIEKLRQHLEIPEWLVFGGSWGSTLALAYSQSHPDKVTGLVLRGNSLLRKKEIDWFYAGGAATIYPDAWEPFRDLIPENERSCFINAYSKRLNSDNKETQALARIENHYFLNKGFFPSDSFLLDNMDKIRHINTTIIQERYDVCCPMISVWDLHKAWPEADFKVVPDAGHSANEPGITAELMAANEKLKNLIKNGRLKDRIQQA